MNIKHIFVTLFFVSCILFLVFVCVLSCTYKFSVGTILNAFVLRTLNFLYSKTGKKQNKKMYDRTEV